MADARYIVAIEFQQVWGSTLNQGMAGIANMQSATNNLRSSMGSVSRELLDGMSSAVDGIVNMFASATADIATGLAKGLTEGIKAGLKFNAFVEQSEIGVAGIQHMLADIPVPVALTRAKESVEHLRDAAAKLPGEFKDAMSAFQSILPAGLNHGVPMDRLEKMAANSVGVSATLGIPQQVAARELGRMLEGHATSAMPLVSKLGITAKEFNALTPEKRFAKIEGMYGKLEPLMKQFEHSWIGVMSTAADYLKQFFGELAAPLGNSIKKHLKSALDWFEGNKPAILQVAHDFGVHLENAFNRASEFIQHWGPLVADFGKNLYNELHYRFQSMMPLFEKIGKRLEAFLKDPEAFNKLESVAKLLVGMKLGGDAASIGGKSLGGLANAGMMAQGMGVGGEALATGAAEAGAALAVLAVGLVGMADILTDTSNAYHPGAVTRMEQITASLDTISTSLVSTDSIFRKLADTLGAFWLAGIEKWSEAGAAFASKLEEQRRQYGTPANTLDRILDNLSGKDRKLQGVGEITGREKVDLSRHLIATDENTFAKYATKKTPAVHLGGVKIEIKMAPNADPDRVARATVGLIKKTLQNPLQSPMSPNKQLTSK